MEKDVKEFSTATEKLIQVDIEKETVSYTHLTLPTT